ncbi:hypothetical protein WD_0847 [Wolbachia endosymbiont of Drosophila melanogaster]|nr:hypothetical protein WD_0847 [Wolbachia endosymbiont of Drosophila melanogaster]
MTRRGHCRLGWKPVSATCITPFFLETSVGYLDNKK